MLEEELLQTGYWKKINNSSKKQINIGDDDYIGLQYCINWKYFKWNITIGKILAVHSEIFAMKC